MAITVLNTDAGLTGKTIGDLESTQTVTGQKTFDRDPSAPFVVTSGSAVVANLDADKVDGIEGTALLQKSGGVMTGNITWAETDNGNSSTADTIDWSVSHKQKSTLTGNCTFTFTAPSGPCSVLLRLIQDGSGSRLVTWPAAVKWPAGTAPVLSTGAAAVDIVAFYYNGTNYYGSSALNFS